MRIPFRQGIVTAPPGFLQQTGPSVSLVVATPAMVTVAFADGAANYLHTERLPVSNAWTGPFAPGTDYWLYWDINPATGQVTYGHTLLEPIERNTAPLAPAHDQHWFDTALFKMKVWNATAGRWIPKIRVFAAKLQGGSVLISVSVNSPAFTGTQMGSVVVTPVSAGALVFDTNGDPVKRNNGTFFTTEDVVVASVASASQVKLSATMIEAVATANLPAFSIVQFVDFNQINLATTALVEQGAYGIIEQDAAQGEVVNVALQGVITNFNWNWTAAGVNAPLYVTNTGQLTPNQTADGVIVAYVVDTNTIVLRPTLQTVSYTTAPPASLTVREEGTSVQTAVSSLNFIGANVTAAAAGAGAANVTITASSPLAVQEEGVNAQTAVSTINFVGAGVTATAGGAGVATVTIPGGGGGGGPRVQVFRSTRDGITPSAAWYEWNPALTPMGFDAMLEEFLRYDSYGGFEVMEDGVYRLTLTVAVTGGPNNEQWATGTIFSSNNFLGPNSSAHWKPVGQMIDSLAGTQGYTDEYVFAAPIGEIVQIAGFHSNYNNIGSAVNMEISFQVEWIGTLGTLA